MRAGVWAVAVLLAACQQGAPPGPSTPAATATAAAASPSPRPTAVPTASPTPEPTARPGVEATAVGTLPESFRLVALETEIADGFHTRLWLVDLNERRPPTIVAEWEGPADPVGGLSVSDDGRSVLVAAAGPRSRVALYLLRPETGATIVLYQESDTVAVSARISPDGQRFAFAKYPAQGGSDLGVWAGAAAGGELVRIARPSTASTVPAMPLAFSIDSAWLAFTREADSGGSEVRLVPATGGIETLIGPGDAVSWRRNPPQLLVAATTSVPSRAYAYDVDAGRATDVVTSGSALTVISSVQWHPALERFVYVESQGDRANSGGIWIRNADGTSPSRVDVGVGFVYDPRWSRDGTRLTAIGGGDDSVVPLLELFSGRRIAVLCRRGGIPPADCV